ncbi:hypothetical protein JKF63_02980 [Porcisia hertigi]|uniref:BILBO1 N-terminal domain-containing protein n=1 Tax=Porcisia hertigi TaxID=2761500 RepID=A0A836IE40_9TRYP|nr:hypothetical protein JKF63_02980 [Porcisia hertigi]
MEFPVFVASDVHGEKVNLALRFNPRTLTLHHFMSAASRLFDALADFLHLGLLQPFSAAYIFSDVHCQWHLLQDRAQFSPCCQVYVFRDQLSEVVSTIPDPLGSSGLLSLRSVAHDRVSSSTCTAPSPELSPLNSPTSMSPPRLVSTRWALPKSSRHLVMLRHRPTASSLPRRDGAPAPCATSVTQRDETLCAHDSAGGDANARVGNEAKPPHPTRSRRFRLPILSPAPETQLHPGDATSGAANVSLHAAVFATSDFHPEYAHLKRHHPSDPHTALSGPPPYTREAAIARSWYDPSRHASASTLTNASASDGFSRKPLSAQGCGGGATMAFSSQSTRSSLPLPTSNYGAEMLPRREPGRGPGRRILRDERVHMASKLQSGVDALRLRLQKEASYLKQIWSVS